MDGMKTLVTSFLTRVSGVLSLCISGVRVGRLSSGKGCAEYGLTTSQGIGKMISFRAFVDLLWPGIYQHDDPGLGIGRRCTIMASYNILAIHSKQE